MITKKNNAELLELVDKLNKINRYYMILLATFEVLIGISLIILSFMYLPFISASRTNTIFTAVDGGMLIMGGIVTFLLSNSDTK